MSRDFKIKLRSYDAHAGYATFDVPPGSPLSAALASGVLGSLTVAVEPAEASTAGPEGPHPLFRTQLSDARAERDAAVRDHLAMVTALDETRAVRDRWLRERDDYAVRLRATDKRLATVAASNDRLAAQVTMLEAQLAATESQREAACTQVAAFGDMLAAAWPIVRDMFTQIYLRMEPLMRSASGRPCAPDCDGFVTRGNQHRDECPNNTDPRCWLCGNQMGGRSNRHAVDCPNA